MQLLLLALSVALVPLSYAESFNCNNNAINDDLRAAFLNYHNNGRRRIAKGEQNNVGGKKLNKAANMNKLRWNCDMEKQVHEYMKSCNALGGRLGPYYSLVTNFNGAAPVKMVAEFSMKMWWIGVENNPIPDTNEYTVCALKNFAQMANARATEIGCSVTKCGNKMQIGCLYNAIGNVKGQPMWETGEPCSECVGNATCEDGLCARPEEKPEDGTSTICSTSGMTDKIRTRILNIHNELRSLVARGLARNGTQGYAPKASAMYKLKYDCKLEELAMNHAKTCVYGHRPNSERPNIGENIYTLLVPGSDRTMNGEWATTDWFYELKRYGVFADNRFTGALNTRPNTVVGHYTQLAWGTTKYIGCGVQNCDTQTIVVCNYSPSGNMRDQLIYDVGTPCSKCPSGTECAADEGLCIFP